MRSSPEASLIPVLKTHFDHLNRRADLRRTQEQKLPWEIAMGKQKLPMQQRYSQPAAATEHQPSHQLVSQQHLLPITLPEGTECGTVLSSPFQHLAVCGRTPPQDTYCKSASASLLNISMTYTRAYALHFAHAQETLNSYLTRASGLNRIRSEQN